MKSFQANYFEENNSTQVKKPVRHIETTSTTLQNSINNVKCIKEHGTALCDRSASAHFPNTNIEMGVLENNTLSILFALP